MHCLRVPAESLLPAVLRLPLPGGRHHRHPPGQHWQLPLGQGLDRGPDRVGGAGGVDGGGCGSGARGHGAKGAKSVSSAVIFSLLAKRLWVTVSFKEMRFLWGNEYLSI